MSTKRNLGSTILSLRNGGMTYRKIQKELQCSRSTINYHCDKAGLTNIGKIKIPVDDAMKATIADYYNKQFPSDKSIEVIVAEIAKYFKLSVSTIKKYKNYKPQLDIEQTTDRKD